MHLLFMKHERRDFAQTIIVPFNNWLEPNVGDGRVEVRTLARLLFLAV